MEHFSESQITVIGMGIIGSRCADNLSAAGMNIRTWNRTPKGRHDAVDKVGDAVDGSEIVFFYLNNSFTCREIFETIRPQLQKAKIIINCSTIDLETTRWLATQCTSIGCGFLDCPFTGSKVAAERGELVYYVGGDQDLLDQYREILQITAKDIIPMGQVGDATVVKIATNLISASTVQVLSEALAIVSANGIPTDKFISAVNGNACGSVLSQMKLPTMASGDYETHFSLENMLKDVNFGLELSKNVGLKTPGTQTTASVMQALCDKGSGHLDFSSIYKQFDV